MLIEILKLLIVCVYYFLLSWSSAKKKKIVYVPTGSDLQLTQRSEIINVKSLIEAFACS